MKLIDCFSSCPPEQEFLEIRTTGGKYYSPRQKVKQALPLREESEIRVEESKAGRICGSEMCTGRGDRERG